jgi:hypothetical protein
VNEIESANVSTEEIGKALCFLDASVELENWFGRARFRVPSNVTVEWQPKNKEKQFANRAGLNLSSDNFLATISVIGTEYGGQRAYGHIDYDCIDKESKKGICDYAEIDNCEQLIQKLDEFLDNFIKRLQ